MYLHELRSLPRGLLGLGAGPTGTRAASGTSWWKSNSQLEATVADAMALNPNSTAWINLIPLGAPQPPTMPPFTNYRAAIQDAYMLVENLPKANVRAELFGKAWMVDKALQDRIIADLNTTINAAKRSVVSYLHGGSAPVEATFHAILPFVNEIHNATPDPEGSTPAWQTIGKGVATAAVAMVGAVAGGYIAIPLVMVGAAITATAEAKAANAVEKQIDQATEDLMALKAEQEAWEKAAAAIVPDTYVLMIEQTEAGRYGKLEDASAATISLTVPGDRFEVLLNGKSLGIRIRTSTGSMAVPDDVGVQIYAIARDQMTQFVAQAENEVAKSGGVPWWLIGGGAAAAVAAQFL